MFFFCEVDMLREVAQNCRKLGARPEKFLCEQLRCPKNAERGKSTRRFKSRFRLSLRNKQKLTSLRWIGWLRLGMLAQACGARKISKTLQDQSPTDWRSKHKFTSVRPIRWLRPRMKPAKCSSKLWSYVPLPACCL